MRCLDCCSNRDQISLSRCREACWEPYWCSDSNPGSCVSSKGWTLYEKLLLQQETRQAWKEWRCWQVTNAHFEVGGNHQEQLSHPHPLYIHTLFFFLFCFWFRALRANNVLFSFSASSHVLLFLKLMLERIGLLLTISLLQNSMERWRLLFLV